MVIKTKPITDPKPIRIFAFSDWRIQPLELADAMLDAAGDIDLVVYAGDDVVRFLIEKKSHKI